MDASLDKDTVAGRIRSARKQQRLTQSELAERVGVHRATVAHWEADRNCVPSVDHLRKLSRELKLAFDWLALGNSENSGERLTVNPIRMRSELESRLIALSRHLPMSILAKFVALLETSRIYLE